MSLKHNARNPRLILLLVLSSLMLTITLSTNAEVNSRNSNRSPKMIENNVIAKNLPVDKVRNNSSQKFLLDLKQKSSAESILFKDFKAEQFSSDRDELAPIIDILCFVACKAVGGSVSECVQFCTGNPNPH